MNLNRTSIYSALRLLAVVAAFTSLPVHADEYEDVSQLLRAGKMAEAASKAEIFLTAKPRDPQMRFLKGVIQRNAGKQAEAIVTFTKLTEDYPELPEPYNNLAVLYAGQNQFDKARAALEMAIRTNPSYATAHENLGDVYARLASQAYNKALQLDSANAAVPPKLALIREVFKPNLKTQPAASAPTAPKPASAPTPPPSIAKVPATVAVPAPVIAPSSPVTPTKLAAKPALATPVAATPASAPAQAVASDSAVKDVEATVQAWAKSWASKDMAGYLGSYGKEFDPPGKQARSAWEQERRSRIVGKSNISVKLENLHVTVNANKAVAKFRQDYHANSLAVSSRKTLDLVKTGDRWLIVKESTGN